MYRPIWLLGGTMLIVSACLLGTVSAQMDDAFDEPTTGSSTTAPVGTVDDAPTDGPLSPPGDADLVSSYPGPLGRVNEWLPHDTCTTCFTAPGLDEYQIFEQIVTDDRDVILPRLVPNPAPLEEGEARETVDSESGEDIWYIGKQAFVGPTDEDYWSDEAPRPTIELLRIKTKHEDAIMSIKGVHSFGIGHDALLVSLEPDHASNSDRIPLSLEGVPVRVQLSTNKSILRHHKSYQFRPVPIGAGISAYKRGSSGRYVGSGTLGPVIVRDRPYVGSCCQLLSLTNAHVVKDDPEDGPLTANTVEVHQATRNRFDGSLTRIGYVTHSFDGFVPCNTQPNTDCNRLGAPINSMHINPDIAAINHGFFPSPFNNPSGLEPTRKLHKSISDYINGPSGKIKAASRNHRHRVWGSRVPATSKPRVHAVGVTQIMTNHESEEVPPPQYKVCCVNVLEYETAQGDSGALVAYAGTGNRHVAGVVMGGGVELIRGSLRHVTYYIKASDIMTAFRNTGYRFSHFWGTKSDYRRPSTSTCDNNDC